jgi:hypothetical protein
MAILHKDNRFYVYFHKRRNDGKVFYVGKGSGERAYSTNKRTTLWEQEVDRGNGAIVELVSVNLTETEAIELEIKMIDKYKDQLINQNNNSVSDDLDKETLLKLFYYDETSPTYLRWNRDAGRGKQKKEIGVVAGYVDRGVGYSRVNTGGKMYLCHRLIWIMHNGNIPTGMQINHINHIRSDNRISNLELVTRLENNHKKKKKDSHKVVYNSDNIPVSVRVDYLDEHLCRRQKTFPILTTLEDAKEKAISFKNNILSTINWNK